MEWKKCLCGAVNPAQAIECHHCNNMYVPSHSMVSVDACRPGIRPIEYTTSTTLIVPPTFEEFESWWYSHKAEGVECDPSPRDVWLFFGGKLPG